MSGPANPAWVWIDAAVLRAVHEEQLVEHGGAPGVRDLGLFESALVRPRHLAMYGEPDLADLAAAYGHGLARNPPFVDGNKRTAFVAIELCLLLNGQQLAADDAACVLTTLALAAGELTEDELAAWLRLHMMARER
jgi:death-on-curing protein